MKMHLPARAPNEGARLLARWVMGLSGGIAEAAQVMGTGADRVQRMVEGNMVPGLDVGTRLSRRIGVKARDFHAAPAGGWFDAAEPLAQAA